MAYVFSKAFTTPVGDCTGMEVGHTSTIHVLANKFNQTQLGRLGTRHSKKQNAIRAAKNAMRAGSDRKRSAVKAREKAISFP